MRWLALSALVAVMAGAACGKANAPVPERPTPTPEASASRAAGSRTVTDMAGRLVNVDEEVKTVVAMSPSALDFALALGLEVVGRPTDTPESVAPGAKPVGSTISPDFNAIAALEPDLVLADAAYHSGRTRDFDRFAHPVFVLSVNSYADVISALEALGEATGNPDAANAALKTLESRADEALASAKSRSVSAPAPKVLILTGGGRDVFAGGDGSYLGSLVRELGATNVYATAAEGGPLAGYGVVDVGQSAALAPDVVLVLSSGVGELAREISTNPAWANTPAVQRSRIYELDTTLFLRAAGPRVAEALETLLPLLWPSP